MLAVACCLQPFVDDVHPLQSLFLPRLYALLIPVVAGVIAMIGLGIISKFFILTKQRHCLHCLLQPQTVQLQHIYSTQCYTAFQTSCLLTVLVVPFYFIFCLVSCSKHSWLPVVF